MEGFRLHPALQASSYSIVVFAIFIGTLPSGITSNYWSPCKIFQMGPPQPIKISAVGKNRS